jgi:molybdopterin-guanine dinucleotide biosynthesis protein A
MGRDKALLDVDGVPMARRVVDALAGGGCAPVVLVGGEPATLAPIGVPVVADRYPGEGPLGGVLTALEHAVAGAPDAQAVLVAACDLPALTADVVRTLRAGSAVAALDIGSGWVCVARGDRSEPALAVWSTSCLAPLREAFDGGERALWRGLQRLRVIEVAVDPATVRNVNTPGDLSR